MARINARLAEEDDGDELRLGRASVPTSAFSTATATALLVDGTPMTLRTAAGA